MEEHSFSVVAGTFFGEQEVARYPTLEQAEWRASELNAWTKRNPRGYIQYLVRRTEEPGSDEWVRLLTSGDRGTQVLSVRRQSAMPLRTGATRSRILCSRTPT